MRLIMRLRRPRSSDPPLFSRPRIRLGTLKKHSTKVFRMALPLGLTFCWMSLENIGIISRPVPAFREPAALLSAVR
jgi:hypothetical protein